MPLSAIDAHLADYILSPADMPDLVQTHVSQTEFTYNEETLQYIYSLIKKKQASTFLCIKKHGLCDDSKKNGFTRPTLSNDGRVPGLFM